MDRRQFKATSIFRILEQQIKMELREYRDFIEETSSELDLKINQIEKNFEKIKDSDNEDEYSDILIDEYWKYDKMFSKFTYNPMLLSVYGFLEHWLKRLCEFDNRKGFSNISVADLSGRNYIEKSRLYLEKVALISLTELEKDWKRIQKIQQIRNLITHHNSNIFKGGSKKNYNQEIFKLLQDEESIEFDEKTGDFYIKNKKFILEIIDIIENYLKIICEEVSRVKVVAKNTSLPYDMTSWGKEKTEGLLNSVIHGLNMLDRYEERDDEFKLEDTLNIMRGQFETMAWDLTKLFSFFYNGEWTTSDREIIVNERNDGLEKLKKLHKN